LLHFLTNKKAADIQVTHTYTISFRYSIAMGVRCSYLGAFELLLEYVLLRRLTENIEEISVLWVAVCTNNAINKTIEERRKKLKYNFPKGCTHHIN